MKKIEAKLIESNLTHQIRLNVLWPHKKKNNCYLKEDNLEDTFHIGVFFNNRLISIGTFIKEKNILLDNKKEQYRLRAMATEKKFQKKSMGKKLILFAERILKKKKIKLLWCDARKEAIPFYSKLGFHVQGEYYEIPKIGLHKLMYLYL